MGDLFLDVRNRLIGEREIFRGTLSQAAIEPRAIIEEALLRSASAILPFHSSLSGIRRLVRKTLGTKLVDHLVLGSGGRWVSLGRRGAW